MDEHVAIIRVVVASPADVQSERDIVPDVLDELNRGVCRTRGVRFEAIRWETDAYPGFHELGPQGLIDPILRLDECDVLLGVFWKRFGSPTSTGESGTEHEIARAFESWKANRRPEIMVYFNAKSYTPKSKAEADQWGRVLEFREKFPKEGLFWEYRGRAQFRDLVRIHLTNYVLNRMEVVEEADPRWPSDYFAVQTRIIEEYSRSFAGREDVAREFDGFMASEPRGYFIIRGGPGQGKTAVCCDLIRKRGYVHHLISRSGGRTETDLILRSLLTQVRPRTLQSEASEPLAELIKEFEESLLGAAAVKKPRVLVIDGLDELPATAGPPPYLVAEALPDGVYYVISSRPGDALDRFTDQLSSIPHHCHELGPLNYSDMEAVLKARKPSISSVEIERVAEACQGHPLYLRAVADQLSVQPNFNVQELPPTIEGFFRRTTEFMRADAGLTREVLGVLSVARTPLSVRDLSGITGSPQREIDQRGIRPIRQFLLAIGAAYTFYHAKFHEFLTTEILYEDELQTCHAAVASWLNRPKNVAVPYYWESLAYHLFESGDYAELLRTITPEFLAAKVRRLGYAVLEDVELCVRALMEQGNPALVETCVSMVERLREVVGGDIVPDAVRSLASYRAGPEAFRTRLIEPRAQSVAGASVYVGVLPKAEVPADFVEVVPCGERLMIAIGDAPSLGLKSAFAARFIGNLFRQLAEREHIEDLGQLIARINATVSQHEYFRRISLQCIAVDPPRDRINIANAGHPYPVHYSARRGECDILPVRGDLLHDYIVRPGELPTWHQYRLEVEPGDIIILVSDGLTEGHILQGDPYEYRFTGVVEKHRNDGPAVIGEAILDDWKAHLREEDSADDVTVVVVVLERARTAR